MCTSVMLPEETEKGGGSLILDLEKIASRCLGADSEREQVLFTTELKLFSARV